MSRSLILAGLVAVVVGCRTPEPPPPPTPLPPTPRAVAASRPASRRGSDLPKTLVQAQPKITARRVGPAPKDPLPPIQLATKFEIYDITLPAGAVSRNEPFWKIIDEEQVDPGTYDVLRRNGVRVGVAPVTAWPALRDQIANLPATTQLMTVTGHEATNIELPMKKDVVNESIFCFMPDGSLVGRTFERCENILAVSFQQTPRKAGQLRVAISPLVRGTQKHLVYTVLGNEGEFNYAYSQRALDVNLRAEIPLDYLLIVAPSDDARTPSSLGHAYFMTEGPAEKQEHVLVMVPRMFRFENETTAKK